MCLNKVTAAVFHRHYTETGVQKHLNNAGGHTSARTKDERSLGRDLIPRAAFQEPKEPWMVICWLSHVVQ